MHVSPDWNNSILAAIHLGLGSLAGLNDFKLSAKNDDTFAEERLVFDV